VVSGVARHGIHGYACLEAPHGDDHLLLHNLESQGVGSQAEDGIGAIVERVEGGDHNAVPDPDKAATEISQELAEQLVTRIVPGQ
jgi:hypothetical protein